MFSRPQFPAHTEKSYTKTRKKEMWLCTWLDDYQCRQNAPLTPIISRAGRFVKPHALQNKEKKYIRTFSPLPWCSLSFRLSQNSYAQPEEGSSSASFCDKLVYTSCHKIYISQPCDHLPHTTEKKKTSLHSAKSPDAHNVFATEDFSHLLFLTETVTSHGQEWSKGRIWPTGCKMPRSAIECSSLSRVQSSTIHRCTFHSVIPPSLLPLPIEHIVQHSYYLGLLMRADDHSRLRRAWSQCFIDNWCGGSHLKTIIFCSMWGYFLFK